MIAWKATNLHVEHVEEGCAIRVLSSKLELEGNVCNAEPPHVKSGWGGLDGCPELVTLLTEELHVAQRLWDFVSKIHRIPKKGHLAGLGTDGFNKKNDRRISCIAKRRLVASRELEGLDHI